MIIRKEGRFIYADLSEAQVEELKKITPERMFVTEETMNYINALLHLEEQTSEEALRAIRNSVVKSFDNELEKRDQEGFDMMIRLSMITAVIDHYKYIKGFEV